MRTSGIEGGIPRVAAPACASEATLCSDVPMSLDGLRRGLGSRAARCRARSGSSEAFVTNQTGDTLSVVDLATLTVAATIPIGGKPAGIAMAPDGARAYVTAPEGKELVVVDAKARAVAEAHQGRRRSARRGGAPGERARLRGRLVRAQDLRGRPWRGYDRRRDRGRQVAVRRRRHARRRARPQRRPRQQRGVLHRCGHEYARRLGAGRRAPVRSDHRRERARAPTRPTSAATT